MRLCVERDELLVLLDRSFGPAEAQEIDRKVAAMGRLSRVTLDFSRALDFQHHSLAALARTLTRLRETRVAVRGLSLRQTCVLQECVEEEGMARA